MPKVLNWNHPPIHKLRLFVHIVCLAVLSVVVHLHTAPGTFGFLIPLAMIGVALAFARLYKRLSGRALVADIVGSVSLTLAISIMVGLAPLNGLAKFAANAFLLIGIIAIAMQIGFNVVDHRRPDR